MCQSQCRIEMSTFAAEWSTIAKSAVSNILYQSKGFPVRYYNICGEAKNWPRIWMHEFQKLHFQVRRLSIWVKFLVPGLEEFSLFPVVIAPCQVLSSHYVTLINNAKMFCQHDPFDSCPKFECFLFSLNFPLEKNIFQNSLAFTKEIKHKRQRWRGNFDQPKGPF